MMLAGLLRESETAVVCDLAEYYGILDYRSVPLRTLGMLVAGLREDSRTMMLASGQKIRLDTALMAASLDRLSFLAWAKTKDASKNRNRPKSVYTELTADHSHDERYVSFDTGEDFQAAWERIARGG